MRRATNSNYTILPTRFI